MSEDIIYIVLWDGFLNVHIVVIIIIGSNRLYCHFNYCNNWSQTVFIKVKYINNKFRVGKYIVDKQRHGSSKIQ